MEGDTSITCLLDTYYKFNHQPTCSESCFAGVLLPAVTNYAATVTNYAATVKNYGTAVAKLLSV